MRRLIAVLAAAVCAAAALPVIKHLHVPVAMRDRVALSANVFRPQQPGRYPTILIRTAYNKGADLPPGYQTFLDHGYAVVIQDVRGRYESEGVFDPLRQEVHDGDDTLNWIAAQPWSDGKIGMIGGSYLGIVQWKAALSGNPHLKAIFPVVSGYDDYRDRFYSTGGALKLGHRLLWMSENMRARGYHAPDFNEFVRVLPVRLADRSATGHVVPMFQEALNHPPDDAFWRAISTRAQLDKIRVPVFLVGGWYDNFAQSDLEAFCALRRRSSVHRIAIGPWPHNMSLKFSDADFGVDSSMPVRTSQLQWFDQWLKGKDSPLLARPAARLFVMGANRWREDNQWPPTAARPAQFFLSSSGHANSLDGDGILTAAPPRARKPDTFTYDPRQPVPTRGGPVCCNPKVFPWGPADQRSIERRRDVLVYTSAPMARDLEVVGPVRAALYVSTSAPDTDFTAKLVDVFPNGEARNLTDGILRLRYRNSLSKPEPAVPGDTYAITIDAGVTAIVFRKGHRVRLEISSSNFPRFDRNPNTGRPIADESVLQPATQTIYHDRAHPSRLILYAIR